MRFRNLDCFCYEKSKQAEQDHLVLKIFVRFAGYRSNSRDMKFMINSVCVLNYTDSLCG